jgi:hypothetical protein
LKIFSGVIPRTPVKGEGRGGKGKRKGEGGDQGHSWGGGEWYGIGKDRKGREGKEDDLPPPQKKQFLDPPLLIMHAHAKVALTAAAAREAPHHLLQPMHLTTPQVELERKLLPSVWRNVQLTEDVYTYEALH